MVDTDPARVEAALVAGELACPGCGGELRPWAHGRRRVRDRQLDQPVRVRRSRCQGCRGTHVLLPVALLARRRDLVELIGEALVAHARGCGQRTIAAGLDLPRSTVRGWLGRFGARSVTIREHFTRLAGWLEPGFGPIGPRGSPVADAVEAIGVAAAAAARRLGPGPGSAWELAAGATGGWLLCNTPAPFPTPW
jgi:Domain of unknown function (DUF6431)